MKRRFFLKMLGLLPVIKNIPMSRPFKVIHMGSPVDVNDPLGKVVSFGPFEDWGNAVVARERFEELNKLVNAKAAQSRKEFLRRRAERWASERIALERRAKSG